MIDREHDLPITRQAEVLNISRGSVGNNMYPTRSTRLGCPLVTRVLFLLMAAAMTSFVDAPTAWAADVP